MRAQAGGLRDAAHVRAVEAAQRELLQGGLENRPAPVPPTRALRLVATASRREPGASPHCVCLPPETTLPNQIQYEFDDPQILPGGFSAFLRFSSPFSPTDAGGAEVTNALLNFAQVASGVTTPIPEPGTALLVLAGLAGLGAQRRRG